MATNETVNTSRVVDDEAGPFDNPQLENRYLPVDVAILRGADDRPFNLYIAPHQGPKVLFCAKGTSLGRARLARLADSKTVTLYVHMDETAELQKFLERVVQDVVRDNHISVPRRTKILYGAAQAIMADIMAQPSAADVHRRGARLASTVIDMMLNCPEGLRSLAGLFTTDYYTYTHSVHVCILGAGLCQRICTRDRKALERYATGLLLHDIGKTFVPTAILNKPGKLDDSERGVMNQHPISGFELLRRQRDVHASTLKIVAEHHEKCDGSGYPKGLRANHLDMASRIAAVVDIFDAVTTARPYRSAMSYETGLKILDEEATANRIDADVVVHLKAMTARLKREDGEGRQRMSA